GPAPEHPFVVDAAPPPAPAAPPPPPDPAPVASPYAQYCFVSNKLMLTTSLPVPSQDVVAEVYYFHELPEAEKLKLLPLLGPFFKDPENTPLTQFPEEQRPWLRAIQKLNEQKQRSVAVWLSRYCANPEKALSEIGPPPQNLSPLAPPTQHQPVPPAQQPQQPAAEPEDPALAYLKQYCFVSNKLMLTTDLPIPPSEVLEAIIFFHQLPEEEKKLILPRLKDFFVRPETTGILLGLPQHLVEWLENLTHLNEAKFRGVAVWLSRYCYAPQKTLASIGPIGVPDEPIQSKKVPTGVLDSEAAPTPTNKWVGAGRATVVGMPLKVASFAGNLLLASGVSLSLLAGMVFVLMLAMGVVVSGSEFAPFWLLLSIILTMTFNLVVFLISPILMDWAQQLLYRTRWVPLATIEQLSPESAQVIRRVCQEHKLGIPKLGLIEDQNPTAFTYGNFPNNARVVVSRGLFTYLSDEEAATVYAHELGHIVHWDFAIMTLASTLVQMTYLIYTYIQDHVKGDSSFSKALRSLGLVAYIFYVVGTYIVLFLSRVREYYADHFAAQVTGNPNALSRALVKIAYGIVAAQEEERVNNRPPSRLIEGTRALGIYDGRAASGTATAYRLANEGKSVGLVFLWDLFNPWAWWMELNSTHPLTGKRIRALSTYAEQYGIPSEFDMGRVVAEGRKLDKSRLYGSFVMDVIIMHAPWIGLIVGVLISLPAILMLSERVVSITLGSILLCVSLGYLLLMLVKFPRFKQGTPMSILKAMVNPYASPLRGIPIELEGEVIGRGDAGNVLGSDLKFQDATGMIFLRYASRFGPLGNLLFGATQVKKVIGRRGKVTGWFRRGVAPWVDLAQIQVLSGQVVNSYPAFWGYLTSLVGIIIGVALLVS
ncbi:MAG: zinc metalloprotease HtpX, partial [Thermostichales cyanobacterium DRC_bins_46]